jgi:DNA-binding GntR family transcriptional regulator
MFEPLPVRGSTVKEVYQRLRGAIVSGTLPPDSRLYEQRIAGELGVSRTPVREALAMLDAEDLVVSGQNRGTIVRRVTVDEVRETYDVRAVVAMDRPHSIEDEQVRRLGELNADFHRTIGVAAGNRVLARTMEWLLTTPLYARAYYTYTDPLKRVSISDHTCMIELLAERDSDACEQFWREHLYRGRDYMIEHLKTREPGD